MQASSEGRKPEWISPTGRVGLPYPAKRKGVVPFLGSPLEVIRPGPIDPLLLTERFHNKRHRIAPLRVKHRRVAGRLPVAV